MKIHRLSLQAKKVIAGFLHVTFVVVALYGISLMYLNQNFGKGINWIQDETYEDTGEFYSQLEQDVKDVFEYVRYRDIFETNGKIDFSKPMLDMTYGPGDERSYTLQDIIQYTKGRGYFLNDNFVVSGNATAPTPEDMEEAFVDWRAYAPDVTEDGEEQLDTATLEDMSLEVMRLLGNYYSVCNKLLAGSSNLFFQVVYEDLESHHTSAYTNADGKTLENFKQMGKYIHLTGDSVIIDTNLDSRIFSVATSYLTSYNPYQNNAYYMTLALDTSYPHSDAYSKASINYLHSRSRYIVGLVLMVLGCMVSLATLLYLAAVSGHKKDRDSSIVLSNIDKTSTEVGLGILVVTTCAALYICRKTIVRIIHLLLARDAWSYTEQLSYSVVVYFCLLIGGFSLLRRYKAGTIWNNSITKRILRGISIVFTRQDFSLQLVAYFCSYLLATALLTGSAVLWIIRWEWNMELMRILLGLTVFLWLALNLWVLSLLYRNAMQRDRINKAICKLSEGDTSYQVNLNDFSGKEEIVAENLNNLSSGLEAALQEKVKSERLKADLITNVSHDIKTPLTSIINYVGLIRRQNIQDEKVLEYLDVLDQKSQRLKTLTEDLVEASKASSGNLKLEISDINLAELVQQTNGEFKDKFESRRLEIITDLPVKPYIIEADGRRLWRILENLYNNAYKYAMEHSRVYTDVIFDEEEQMIRFTIKNVSANPLNIRAEELTERFVRGDVARTTEGSGLGLSIAKSLTELQHGQFDLYIDGDLFKARVSFPIKKG